MQKIVPNLWYDKEAKEAAELYTSVFNSVFKHSKIKNISTINDTPSGDCDIVTIELAGQEFMLISAGPYFKLNPAISLLVACDTEEEVDALWKKLSPGGMVMMELGSYPFSKKYGWIQDKFGLSWQIMHKGDMEIKQRITPTLMFVGKVCGKAEEAITFYTSVFHKTHVDYISRYEKNVGPDKAETIKHAGFTLEGYHFAAMDSAHGHHFAFNEAVSFIVNCDTQKEIDYYWDKLSAVPASEQCGWLKDKYGVSWQIVPTVMEKMMATKDKEKLARVTQALLKMKKFNIAELEEAAQG